MCNQSWIHIWYGQLKSYTDEIIACGVLLHKFKWKITLIMRELRKRKNYLSAKRLKLSTCLVFSAHFCAPKHGWLSGTSASLRESWVCSSSGRYFLFETLTLLGQAQRTYQTFGKQLWSDCAFVPNIPAYPPSIVTPSFFLPFHLGRIQASKNARLILIFTFLSFFPACVHVLFIQAL